MRVAGVIHEFFNLDSMGQRSRYWIFSVLLLCLVLTVSVPVALASDRFAELRITPLQFPSGWGYYKPVTINNTGNSTALTDYQIKVTVDHVSGKMNSNFSDLRFTDTNGNQLSYWVESYVASTSATVWAKIPSVPAGGTATVRMYYGNPSASDASDFDNTFTKDYADSGLVALWHMDEGSSSTVQDSSGTGNAGTRLDANSGNADGNTPSIWQMQDGTQWDGRSGVRFSTGSALEFDGVDDYVSIPFSTVFDFDSQDFSIEAWINTTDCFSPSGDTRIINYGGTVFNDYILVCENDGRVEFAVCGGSGLDVIAHSTSTVDDGNWHHIVGVRDNTNNQLLIYIDGQLENTVIGGSGDLAHKQASRLFVIGRKERTVGGEQVHSYFEGQIDEVTVYGRALGGGEISAHYERRRYADPEPTTSVGPEASAQHTLQVTKGGTGNGTVTSNPAGIDCGETCIASYASGTQVTLTATPDANSVFAGWSGCDSSSGNQCIVTMNSGRTVTATFTGGCVFEDFSQDTGVWTEYDPDGKIELDFTSDHKLEFNNWIRYNPGYVSRPYITQDFVLDFDIRITASGGNAKIIGPGFSDTLDTIDKVQNGIHVVYYAGFPTVSPRLSINTRVNGTTEWCCSGNPPQPNRINISTNVTYYVRLEKSSSTLTLSVFSDAARTAHVAGSPKTVTTALSGTTLNYFYAVNGYTTSPAGNWEWTTGWIDNLKACGGTVSPTTRTLTVAKAGTGNGTVTSDPPGISCGSDCTEDYDYNIPVTLTATADANSGFCGWSGDCSGSNPSTTITMDAPKTCTATFNIGVATSYRPSEHGFAFANSNISFLTWHIEEPAYVSWCMGMSITSQLYYLASLDVNSPLGCNPSVDPSQCPLNSGHCATYPGPPLTCPVFQAIFYSHFAFNAIAHLIDWNDVNIDAEYERIKTYVSAGVPTVVAMGPASKEDQGHVVVAWKTVDCPNGDRRIYVYDPNWTASCEGTNEVYIEVGENAFKCGISKPKFIAFLPGYVVTGFPTDLAEFVLQQLGRIIAFQAVGLLTICLSPVDLSITDPNGLTLNKTLTEIPDSYYVEGDLDGDGDPDDLLVIPERKIGIYVIKVVPEPGAHPTDTYTLQICLGGECLVLADDVSISNIPEEGYWILSTDTGLKLILAKGDVNGDGMVDLMDVRMCLQIATEFLAGTALQRDAADVDGDGDVDMDDAAILSEYILGIRATLP